MLHFPLLSDAYAAALFGADTPRTEPPPHDGCGESWVTVRPEPRQEDDEDVHAVPDDREDIETARTRPLRLDQIRL